MDRVEGGVGVKRFGMLRGSGGDWLGWNGMGGVG